MSEVRLIDANAAQKAVENVEWWDALDIDVVKCLLGKAPTIDAEPVRHGRWEYKFYPTVWYGPGEPPEWVCSVCEDRAYNTYNFCPNCGAKMDGGEVDD